MREIPVLVARPGILGENALVNQLQEIVRADEPEEHVVAGWKPAQVFIAAQHDGELHVAVFRPLRTARLYLSLCAKLVCKLPHAIPHDGPAFEDHLDAGVVIKKGFGNLATATGLVKIDELVAVATKMVPGKCPRRRPTYPRT